ncbi:MAG TPA: acetate--CoA ligase family protein [Phenylobacterium sp.]|jgi:acyl-CoA synthetase (NDP forming)|nr:acetate--CoA ligase family protein [Phenylobacterium sp.]
MPEQPRSSLDPIFQPKAVAIIGASATATKIGGRPIAFLQTAEFEGSIYPVNPNYADVQGLPAFPTVSAIGAPVDLAIVAVPAAQVLASLEDAARAGVKASIIFSSGFAEVGPQGEALQRSITQLSHASGMRIIGPNCLGVMSGADRLYATFSPIISDGAAPHGHISIVSQSGAFGAYCYAMARERGLGVCRWVTTGNEADVDIGECLDWLVGDPVTKVVVMYMEGCRDGDKLVRALKKAQAARKPVIIVKVGRTEVGAAAAASHTAALAGADHVYDAVFRQFGAFRAQSIEEAFDLAYAITVAGLPRGPRLGMLTVSGGAGVLMADVAAELGLEVPEMPQAAQARIRDRIAFAGTRNPVDITGQSGSDPELMPLAYELMLGDARYDSLVVFLSAAGLSRGAPGLVGMAARMRAKYPDRIIVMSSLFPPHLRAELDAAGVIAFEDPNRAVRTLAALTWIGERHASPAPSHAADRVVVIPAQAMTEPEAFDLLRAQGLPMASCRLAKTPDEAAAAADAFGYPVVLKIVSPDIQHKTEIGGVILGLTSAAAVREGYATLRRNVATRRPDAQVQGVMVAPQLSGGVECILGVQRDPVFGPVVLVGLGGVFAEAMRDVVLRLAPVDVAQARQMISELKGHTILAGWRGSAAADVEALAQALAALSDVAVAAGDQIESIDINPVLVRPAGEGVVALDALVIARRTPSSLQDEPPKAPSPAVEHV